MREMTYTAVLLLRSLLSDIATGSIIAYRLVAPLLLTTGKQPLTWYLAIVASLLYLNFAPVAGKWSDKATGRSLLAMLMIYPVGELLAKVVGRDVQTLSIRSHLSWLAEMDDFVHEFNTIRAINANEIRQISGQQTMAELQMRMADSQDRMVETMASMQSNLPAGKEEQPEECPLLNIDALTNTVFLLIYGEQGSGKTYLAKLIASHRERLGHSIVVCDPHGAARNWGSWRIVGSGRNYKAVDRYLKEFDDQVTADYQEYSEGQTEFPYQTTLADEFTQWGDKCPSAPAFVKSCCSDLRKIGKCVIVISHSESLDGIGKAQGLRKAIDRSAVKIELEAKMNSKGEYEPTGFGSIQYPRQEKQRVRIPSGATPALPSSSAPEVQLPQTEVQLPQTEVQLPLTDRQRLEQVYHSEAANHPMEQRQVSGELSDRHRSLLEWSSGKGWLSPSKVQEGLWSYRGVEGEEIIRDFYTLRDSGYGEIREKYKTVQWSRDEKPTPES